MVAEVLRQKDGVCWRVVRIIPNDDDFIHQNSVWVKIQFNEELTDKVRTEEETNSTYYQQVLQDNEKMRKQLAQYHECKVMTCNLL